MVSLEKSGSGGGGGNGDGGNRKWIKKPILSNYLDWRCTNVGGDGSGLGGNKNE